MDLFSGTSFRSIELGINQAQQKQMSIADNIANADTPGYKPKQQPFSQSLERELAEPTLSAQKTQTQHVDFKGSSGGSSKLDGLKGQYHHNGNGVDIDKEMADLAENQIQYNALIERLNGRFSSLQSVIRGGK
ncbi:flagellar basal body rod protein FlgB [Alkalicoccobacillus murimartini]|uniref:Flagellar basal body rod protein FlgB n=1 Tax=Alkalicoccobacillus murimartini TaxID=171685 RepID=A0ABT9YES7_9BACI|nr:flagellar basal body rod protein FlgB [Alkalicoccobacillus murimartini]MDQ0206350.1 flagellar basal-body rod protein FlgB [Alkalicoccobacillus murimartini]